MDDFLRGTFTSGGIFDKPADVKLNVPKPEQQKGPKLEDFIKQRVDPKPAKPAELTADKRKEAKLKKLQAVADDVRAPQAERDSALRMIKKLRG